MRVKPLCVVGVHAPAPTSVHPFVAVDAEIDALRRRVGVAPADPWEGLGRSPFTPLGERGQMGAEAGKVECNS